MDVTFCSALEYSAEQLAELFTRSFEDYFYPGTTTAEMIALRIRVEQIDLQRSVIMLAQDEPIGLAFLAVRGSHAWCAGFGIIKAQRGKGLARPLVDELIRQAKETGASQFSLEVLTKNAPAIKAYLGAGLEIVRDLQIFEWKADAPLKDELPERGRFTVAEPRELLQHFERLHAQPAAWQRDLPSLLTRSKLQGLALIETGEVCAYVLYVERGEHCIVQDLAAGTAADALLLLQSLQRTYAHITSVNEPAGSILAEAYVQAGFKEIDRQHDLVLMLEQ